MTTYQLNGTFVSPTLTTTPAAINLTDGSTGIIVTNPDTTNSVFLHFVPIGATAPTSAENLRGIRVYPGTSIALTITAEAPYGCLVYGCTNAGSIQINAYGVF